jgi:hypothetical protein
LYFLAVLQAFADSGKDGADVVQNYSIGFYCSVFFPWLLICTSSGLRMYGHTAISYDCPKGKNIGVNQESSVYFFQFLSDNFVIRAREALTCSRYDPRKHA